VNVIAPIVVADAMVAATSQEKFKEGRRVPFFRNEIAFFRRRDFMLSFSMMKKTDRNQGNNLNFLAMSSERQRCCPCPAGTLFLHTKADRKHHGKHQQVPVHMT